MHYWCIDGKYRMCVVKLRNGGKTNFILYSSQNKICKTKMLFKLIIEKKITEIPLIPQ